MSMGKVWLFVFVAISLAEAVFCRQVSGADSQSGWPPFAGSSPPEGQESEEKLPYHSVGTPVYRVTPKQAIPDEPNNQNEFLGNWTNPTDSMWYSKTPRKVGFHYNNLPQERYQDPVYKKMLGGSLSKKLFDLAIKLQIPEKALETKFIQEMKRGILRPDIYGRYMVQDTVYLAHLAELFQNAAQKLEDQGPDNSDLVGSFIERSARYDKDSKQALETWQLTGAECVKKGPAVKSYMAYQRSVVISNPKNLLIATLPCSMLWPWMAFNLIRDVDKENPYKPWFDTNFRELDKQGTTEILVDKNFTTEDEEEALLIFCMGLIMETNFFREAGGEDLLMSPEEVCKKLISSLDKLTLH